MQSTLRALLVLSTFIPATAMAEGIRYDCDTAAGHFSDLELPAPSDPFEVDGKLALRKPGVDKKWVPLARVMIGSAGTAQGPSLRTTAGIVYAVFPEKEGKPATSPVIGFSQTGSGDQYVAPPSANEVSFHLSYDGKTVALEIDGRRQATELATSAPTVRLLCSTGEFLFTDVTIKKQTR